MSFFMAAGETAPLPPVDIVGQLFAFGDNATYQLGDSTTTDRTTPTAIGSANWKHLSASSIAATVAAHSAGVQEDGTLWTWGDNASGQLGLNDTTARTTPTQVGSDTDWKMVACGGAYTLALKEGGSLYASGLNSAGALGVGDTTNRDEFTLVGTGFAFVCASNFLSIGVKTDGTLWVWGSEGLGIATLNFTSGGTYEMQADDVIVGATSGASTTVHAVVVTSGSFAAGTAAGQIWLRPSITGTFGNENVNVGANSNVATVSATLTALSMRTSPVQLGVDTDWESAACASLQAIAGFTFALALKTDGSAASWGRGDYGSLGLGNYTTRLFPGGLSGTWLKLAAGTPGTVAGISDAGELYTWGYGGKGALGDGTSSDRNTPTKVGTDTDWTEIAVGSGTAAAGNGNHLLALKSTGTLWSAGFQLDGRLGDGVSANAVQGTLAQVGVATDWVKVFAGLKYSLALAEA